MSRPLFKPTQRRSLMLLCLLLSSLVILWRVNRPSDMPNLLTNPTVEQDGSAGWQIGGTAGATTHPKQATDNPHQTLLELQIPEATTAGWTGIRQRIAILPLQRYQLRADYRPAQAGWSSAKVVWRVSQFDAAGALLKTAEIANPSPLSGDTWHPLPHIFVSDERAAALEIGLGLFGQQATRVEVDHVTLERYPTPLGQVRQDGLTLGAVWVLAGTLVYGVGHALWPIRRKVLINGGLAMASLLATLIVVEIGSRFIPVSLISPNWPPAYHIPYLDGKSYRLAKNYPATFVTDEAGDRHLAMSNALGVRDIEPPAPDAKQPVMLVLGDSMTFGWAISDVHDTWPRRLDEQLATLRPGADRYHVVNAGVSGYNHYQETLLFQTLLTDMAQAGVKPQVALLSFFSGIWERNLYGPEGRFAIMNGVIMYSSVKQALLNLAGHLLEQSQIDDLKLIGPSRVNAPHQFLLSKSHLYFLLCLLLINRLDYDWDALPPTIDPVAMNYEALKSFKTVAEANGVQPVVAYLPSDNLFTAAKQAKNRELVQQLTTLCQRLDLPFIDPSANMQKLGVNGNNAKETLTLVYNRHYSPQGNLLYAQALAPLLADYLTRLPPPAQASKPVNRQASP